MKTITIKLGEKAYKDIKDRADKHEISVIDFIMRMYGRQVDYDNTPKEWLIEGLVDNVMFDAISLPEAEDIASDMHSLIDTKLEEATEHLLEKEEV